MPEIDRRIPKCDDQWVKVFNDDYRLRIYFDDNGMITVENRDKLKFCIPDRMEFTRALEMVLEIEPEPGG